MRKESKKDEKQKKDNFSVLKRKAVSCLKIYSQGKANWLQKEFLNKAIKRENKIR